MIERHRGLSLGRAGPHCRDGAGDDRAKAGGAGPLRPFLGLEGRSRIVPLVSMDRLRPQRSCACCLLLHTLLVLDHHPLLHLRWMKAQKNR
jgi:hypothetical protein